MRDVSWPNLGILEFFGHFWNIDSLAHHWKWVSRQGFANAAALWVPGKIRRATIQKLPTTIKSVTPSTSIKNLFLDFKNLNWKKKKCWKKIEIFQTSYHVLKILIHFFFKLSCGRNAYFDWSVPNAICPDQIWSF